MDGLLYDVRHALASRVAGGDTRIQSLARALATSLRSLQRRLAEAGATVLHAGLIVSIRNSQLGGMQ